MTFKKRAGVRSVVVIGAIVVVVVGGVVWKSGASSAAIAPLQAKQDDLPEIKVDARKTSAMETTSTKTENQQQFTTSGQQITSNGKPITANDWHPVGPFYFVKGTLASVDPKATPPDVKGPVWTDVLITIDGYVNSTQPQTQDGSMQVSGTSLITFYDLVDKGQNHLHNGDQVIIKCAEYSTPSGKIVWGSKYDDIYYKTDSAFVNNKGDIIS